MAISWVGQRNIKPMTNENTPHLTAEQFLANWKSRGITPSDNSVDVGANNMTAFDRMQRDGETIANVRHMVANDEVVQSFIGGASTSQPDVGANYENKAASEAPPSVTYDHTKTSPIPNLFDLRQWCADGTESPIYTDIYLPTDDVWCERNPGYSMTRYSLDLSAWASLGAKDNGWQHTTLLWSADIYCQRNGNGTNPVTLTAIATPAANGVVQIRKVDTNGNSTQLHRGLIIFEDEKFGDADVQGFSSYQTESNSRSVLTLPTSKKFQLVNMDMTPDTNNASKPMVIVDTVDGVKITKLMAQATGGGKGDADETGTGLPAQRSIETLPNHAGYLQVYNFDSGTTSTPNTTDTVLMRRASGTDSKPELVYIETTPL
jgi:hypothetical protein